MKMLGTADLDLLEAMMAPLPDCPFFAKDSELRYVAANRAMARVCGLADPGGMIGRRVGDFFPPMAALRYEKLDMEVLNTGRTMRDRLELSGPRGDVWLLYSRIPILSAEGETVGVLATARAVSPGESQSPAYARVAEAIRRLQQHFDAPLNIDALAAAVGVSPSQLERDASRILGGPLRSLQDRIRMDHAMSLLNGETSIAQIALGCGYSDQSAFARRFRMSVGMSPSAWRARQRFKRNRPRP